MKNTYPYNREMPVSAKFYCRLCSRISTILADLGGNPDPEKENEVIYLVNQYLGMQPAPRTESSFSLVSRIIFQTLRAEIDAAMERSRRCREAAARRRAAKDPVKVTIDSHSRNTPKDPDKATDNDAIKVPTKAPAKKLSGERHSHHSPSHCRSFKPLKFRPVVTVRKHRKIFRKR